MSNPERLVGAMLSVSIAWAATATLQPGAGPGTADAPAPVAQPLVQTPPELGVGDAAPDLELAEWIQGDPVEALEPGHVYVLDFFASWAPGADEAARALSRLQIGIQDRATVIGIASRNQTRGETREGVARFIQQMGTALTYRVAFDPERAMFARYMTAAGLATIPHTFVIDAQGVIAWQGHPADPQLPSVVDLVAKGEWSPAAYARLQAEDEKSQRLLNLAIESWSAGERERTIELLQEIFEINPARFGQHAVWKFHAIHVELGESERGYEYARSLIEGPMRDSADPLADLAWVILDAPPERTYDDIVCEMAARRALELTGEQHGQAWAAIAMIESRRQNFDEALAAWDRALSFAQNDMFETLYLQRKHETEQARDEALRSG